MIKKMKNKVRQVIRQEVVTGVQGTGIPEMLQSIESSIQELSKESGGGGVAPASEVEKLKLAVENNSVAVALSVIKKWMKRKASSKNMFLQESANMRKIILSKKDRKIWSPCLKALFDSHSVDEFTSDQYADVFHNRFPVMQAASLTQQYVRRRRMKQIGDVPDRWLPYSKEAGLMFADLVNVKHAKTEFNLRIEAIAPKTDVVIKPMVSRGSIGAYIVKGRDEILVPRDQIILHSWDAMVSHAQNLISNNLIENLFMEQELIYADKKNKIPAHDLKFYTFYGEVGCVNEIARDPDLAYWWYTPNGEDIDLGIKNSDQAVPIGVKAEYVEIATELSKKIPAPHMRIDFLVGEDGIFLSEFCSQTGSQVETIIEVVSETWDRKFGNLYLKAEMNLINDLLQGKKFDEINEFNEICEKKYRQNRQK